MKKILTIAISVLLVLPAIGCSNQNGSSSEIDNSSSSAVLVEAKSETPESIVTEIPERDFNMDTQSVLKSYYDAQNQPAFKIFQKNIVGNLADDWTAEIAGLENMVWNYETFAQYHSLDNELNSVSENDELYYCTFSADNDKFGYIVMSYDGSSLQKISVAETEYIYDLQAVIDEIVYLMADTGIDFSTVVASRVLLVDTEKNRTDEVIRLTDKNGNELMYYFADSMLKNHTDIILPEPSVSTTQVSEYNQSAFAMDLGDYGVKILVPANWENNVVLKNLDMKSEDAATYGFLLSPSDMQVEEQYVGLLRIYDQKKWGLLNDATKDGEIMLAVIDGRVYTYLNSLFNQYPQLPQAKLFDELVIADDEVEEILRIEKIQ